MSCGSGVDDGDVSDDLWRWGRHARAVGNRGELEGADGEFDRVLWKQGGAAGDEAGGGDLLASVASMILWAQMQGKDMRRCAGSRLRNMRLERERGDSPLCRYRRIPAAKDRCSSERFHRDDGVSGSRSREKWEREGWGA
jgi:hypothetical protein